MYDLDKLRQTPEATRNPDVAATASPAPAATARPTPEPTGRLPSLSQFQNGRWLARNRPALYDSIRSVGWVRDGIDDSEMETIEQILVTAAYFEDLAESLIALHWVADQIDEAEFTAIDYLDGVADFSEVAAERIVSLDWFTDGITEAEAQVVRYLFGIAYEDKSAIERIVDMPFLRTLEPADVVAVDSLESMVSFRRGEFDKAMAHPSIADGITDDLAPIVAMLNGTAKYNSHLVDTILLLDGVTMERRSVELPLSGKVDLAIVRTGPGAARSLDLLEHAVRTSEELMNERLPANYIGLLFENAVSGGFAGTNFGTHIAILPKYDVDDGSREADFVPHSIAHEVAHYYWSGNADWVDEGVADFMASAIENRRAGRPVRVTNDPCAFARNISTLESLDVDRSSEGFGCNYSLGERLFMDIYYTLGESDTWGGLRHLYRMSQIEEDPNDDHPGTELRIEHVREAFSPNGNNAATVLSRWYDGDTGYDLSRLDLSSPDPALPRINGRIDKAYISLSQDGPPMTSISAQAASDYVLLNLDYSYRVAGAPRETILEIVVFYEDGFEFMRRQRAVIAEAAYIGGTSWHTIGSNPYAPGRYWVYVYDGDRKVVEVQYEVTP